MLDVLIAAVIHLSGDYGIGNTVVLNTASCPLNTVDTGQTINGAEVCEQVNAGSVVIGASYGTTIVQSGWGGYEPYLLNGGGYGLRGGRYGTGFGGGFGGGHGFGGGFGGGHHPHPPVTTTTTTP